MTLSDLISDNAAWATAQSPELLAGLAAGQAPPVLWIGCADSRVPPDVITKTAPGSLFVHRNVANVCSPADLNFMSVLEYAVIHLKVQHIVVCGHQSCGGVTAVVDDIDDTLLASWLAPVASVARHHAEALAALDRGDRIARLIELNVRRQVRAISETVAVRRARDAGHGPQIHGLVFGLSTGRLTDLDCTIGGA